MNKKEKPKPFKKAAKQVKRRIDPSKAKAFVKGFKRQKRGRSNAKN